MASAYRPWSPSTGPGSYYNTVQFNTFQANGIGVAPGQGYNSNMGPNNFPPQPAPAPASENGILLEDSLTYFIAMETGGGGPAAHLLME